MILDLPKGTIEIIEKDNNKVSQCCNTMLETWMDLDPEYSWEKIESAIVRSLNISDQCIEKGKTCCIIHQQKAKRMWHSQ